jgi:hypothetical protein
MNQQEEREVAVNIKELVNDMITIIDKVDEIKNLISQYFSNELQDNETPMGAMKRNQIRKELLEFAAK